MSGIPYELITNIEVIDPVKSFISCKKCDMISEFPIYCEKCEISFCSVCIMNEKKCNICKNENLCIFPSVFRTFYNLLQIKCKNIPCNNVVSFEDLKTHEENCDFIIKNVKENSFVLVDDAFETEKKKSVFIFDNSNKSEIDENFSHFDVVKMDNKPLNEDGKDKRFENNDEKSENSFSFITNNDFSYIKNDINDEEKITQSDNLDENKEDKVEFLIKKVDYLENTLENVLNELNFLKNILIQSKIINQNIDVNHRCNLKKDNENKQKFIHPRNIIKNTLYSLKKCEFCQNISANEAFKMCSNCNKELCINCLIFCQKCNQSNCKNCSKCQICKNNKICKNCMKSCNQCQKSQNSFCDECIKNCDKCHKEFCKICCGFSCKDSRCKSNLCINCCWNCKICYSTFCEVIKNLICSYCGVKACYETCRENCQICLKEFCKNCVIDCEKCNKKICKKCSVKILKNKNFTYCCKKCI